MLLNKGSGSGQADYPASICASYVSEYLVKPSIRGLTDVGLYKAGLVALPLPSRSLNPLDQSFPGISSSPPVNVIYLDFQVNQESARKY